MKLDVRLHRPVKNVLGRRNNDICESGFKLDRQKILDSQPVFYKTMNGTIISTVASYAHNAEI